ncbi:MAG: hypothetical protein E6929_09160 [Clostridium sp.]|nr:hypothetical protein [Clostridium sp.]
MDFMEFQNVISKIEGIKYVKLVFDDKEIQEIHVISNAIRSPKQIVRDIESTLLAIFNYRIDRKIISIAQIDDGEKRKLGRIIYEGTSAFVKDNIIQCEVKLFFDEEEFSSVKRAVNTSLNRNRVVAKAAINTIENIIGQALLFDVEDVVISQSRSTAFVTVIVDMIENSKEEKLIGTAIVRNDLNEAICKATLDAVNRVVEKR